MENSDLAAEDAEYKAEKERQKYEKSWAGKLGMAKDADGNWHMPEYGTKEFDQKFMAAIKELNASFEKIVD